jgi:hypothetical protein
MSLHISVVAIQGDHIGRAEELLGLFGSGPETGPIEVTSLEEASRYIDTHGCKAVYCHLGLTAIVDPELVFMMDEGTCAEISRRLGSQVCGFVCEGVSGTYGFNLFRDGEKVRGFCSTNGKITEDMGQPIAEEIGFDRSLATEVSLIELVARIGFNFWDIEEVDRFIVYGAGRADSAADLRISLQGGEGKKEKRKPWWRPW